MASTTQLQFPPLDFSLLFPDMVNFHMERNPTFPMFVYANEGVANTLTEISFLEFGRATHRVAHALRPSRQGRDGEVVIVIANTDTILHHAAVVGLSIAGWVPFPSSPRNSPEAVVSMMKKVNCSHIVTLGHTHEGLIDGIRRELDGAQLTIFELPTLHQVFPKLGKRLPLILLSLTLPGSNVLIWIHPSSTFIPRVVLGSQNRSLTVTDSKFKAATYGYIDFPSPRRFGAMALPAFHVFGILTQLYAPIAYAITSVVYAPHTEVDPFAQPVIPTSDNMIECLKRVECSALMSVPTFLEQMAVSDEAINVLSKLNTVVYGGGPLAIKIGDKLTAAGVHISSGYGGTEFGILAGQSTKEDIAGGDWMWMRFPDEPKLRWVPQEDNTYELQVLSTETQVMAVENMSDVKGYATSDVFVKHPTKDMWRIVGRADDVIILASGEKTVPAPMESIIASSPLVKGVVMFGRERNQVGVLIEPRPGYTIDIHDEKAVAEFRNQIWPVIDEANKPSPAFSRIFKEMILITSADKPMLRAPKGTVQRKATLKDYDGEINTLYETVEASSVSPDGLAGPSAWTSDVLESWLLEHARAISPNGEVDPHADLFAQGFDSLSVTYLRNRILGALRTSPDPEVKKTAPHLPPNVIFENPTIQLLASRIATLVSSSGAGHTADTVGEHKQAINAMIEKYSVGLAGPADGVLPSSGSIEPAVVLLTGSTGGLGSFLLAELLQSSAVQRVFAFNRPSSTKSIEERQKAAFRDRGLPVNLLDSNKIAYVEADAALERCGLPPAQYEEIRNSVTLIIHNAWRLDFNLAMSSFEDSIRASRNLDGITRRGRSQRKFNLNPPSQVGAGYGEGKYVTERIIVKSGLHATSLRIGQIAGGLGGAWATTDWFPIIVKSSIALGVLPDSAGVVSWLREEEVASAILEASFSKEAPPPAVNIVNPRGAPWAEIMSFVRRSIIQRKGLGNDALPIVSFEDWFALLEKKAENASQDELVKIPAIKLLEFFRALARGDQAIRSAGLSATEAAGMTNFSTTKSQQVSLTMAKMQAIGEVEADAWVSYWISKGAF
ncbi:putative aminoadipate reductase [Chiua virens]|nr:putative aminoadipate reductase [Chiua virens]